MKSLRAFAAAAALVAAGCSPTPTGTTSSPSLSTTPSPSPSPTPRAVQVAVYPNTSFGENVSLTVEEVGDVENCESATTDGDTIAVGGCSWARGDFDPIYLLAALANLGSSPIEVELDRFVLELRSYGVISAIPAPGTSEVTNRGYVLDGQLVPPGGRVVGWVVFSGAVLTHNDRSLADEIISLAYVDDGQTVRVLL